MEMKQMAERLGGFPVRKKVKRILAITLAALMVNSVIGYGVVVNAEAVGGITVNTTDGSIYANGEAIIITDKDGDTATTTDTLIYLDTNKSGAVDSDENPVTLSGVSGSIAEGYNLSQYAIFGGSQSTSVSTTKVTMQGGLVQYIFGGGEKNSAAAESTNVTVTGGKVVFHVVGGGYYGAVSGDTNVTIAGGGIYQHVIGGGFYGTVSGSTNVNISDGYVAVYVFGGGFESGATVGSTNVTISGEQTYCPIVFGGGFYGAISGSTNVIISGGTIQNVVGGGGFASEATAESTNVVMSGGTVKDSIYGGGVKGSVSENANVTISGGTVKSVYGGGSTGSVGGNTNVTISGGTVTSVRGGGEQGNVLGNKTLQMGVDAPASLDLDKYTFLQYEIAFYDGAAKLANPEPQWITEATSETGTYQKTGNTAAMPSTVLKKEGKIFDGWKTTTVSSYDFTIPVTAATKIYAAWVDAPTYAVTYNGSGSTGGSVPVDSKTYYEGANVPLAGNTGNLTKTGYAFGGWATAPNGEAITSYTMIAEPVTFYAVWKSVPANNNGGGSSSGGSSTGGGGSTGSSMPAAAANTPAIPASPISPAAVKQAEAAIAGLTTTQKQETSKNLQEYLPYTCLAAKELTLEQLQKLTNNQLTKEVMETIIQKPELLKALGIDVAALSTQVLLKPAEHPEFKDVAPSHWASDTIQKAAQLGLAAGSPDGTFAPSAPLQVADAFTFLDRVLLLNNITTSNLPRSTVEKYITNKDHWAFNHMASIASKLSEQTLKTISEAGDKPLTRELLAQVLYEITKGKLKAAKEVPAFTDTQSSPYQDAINYCIAAGLLNGTSNNTMSPQKELTRAEMMTILIRLDEMLK